MVYIAVLYSLRKQRDVIHEDFDQQDTVVKSDRWMVLHVQSHAGAVTATHAVMGEPCQKVR